MQDLFFDVRRRTGYLLSKLKNVNTRRKRFNTDDTKQSNEQQAEPLSKVKSSKSQKELGGIKYLMKIKNSNDINDFERIGKILDETFDERRVLIKLSKNVYNDFPYLFASTKIVCVIHLYCHIIAIL